MGSFHIYGQTIDPSARVANSRSVTLDLAGTAGALADGAPFAISIRDESLRLLRPWIGAASGVGSSANSWVGFFPALGGVSGIFPEYDGSRDVLSVVLTMTGPMTWDEPGVGPRLIRWTPSFAQTSDVFTFRSTSTTDRTIFVTIAGAGVSPSVNSGVYDARSVSAIFSPGAIVAGWSSAVPTQGQQITPAKAQRARAAAYSAIQTDGGLLAQGPTDPFAFGLSSLDGAKTSTVAQSVAGVTFGLGASSMTIRYVHLFHQKGEG